jgi:hypothetical protein
MGLKRVRCSECNNKVGIIGFPCKCLDTDNNPKMFCSSCRIHKTNANDFVGGHICTFDYKAFGREQFEKNNPKIQTIKIETI